MSIKKHVGKIKSTDQRCVVVFMQLPDDKNNALIINIESLPPRYEQILMEVVDSTEGQQERNLADALARRMVPETGLTILQEFHNRGFLRAEPVDNLIMLPRPNTPFPLRDILTQMGELDSGEKLTEEVGDVKYNPVVANQSADASESAVMMGRNLLAEAEMLEAEARRKREQAYRTAPILRQEEIEAGKRRGPGRPTNAEKAAQAALADEVLKTQGNG